MGTIDTGKIPGRMTYIDEWGRGPEIPKPENWDPTPTDGEVIVVPPRNTQPRQRRILECGFCGLRIEAGKDLTMFCGYLQCPFQDNSKNTWKHSPDAPK